MLYGQDTVFLWYSCHEVFSYWSCPPVDAVIQVFGKTVVHLQESRVMFRAIGAVSARFQRVSAQGVHVDLTQRHGAHHLYPNWRSLTGRFWRARAGAWLSPPEAETGHARVWWGGWGRLDKLSSCLAAHLFVLFNVDVHSEDSNRLRDDERESSKVERPAVIVLALLVLIALVAGITSVAGDVNDDPNNVAQT